MDFLELAKRRYSERRFDPRPVEQEKLDRILEAGRVVPTAHNNQPQRIYVLRSPEALETLRSVTAFHYNAPLALLVCYDADTVWRSEAEQLYPDYHSGEQDASICATTMMYEAEELGVHSLWVRGFDAKAVLEAYRLPEAHRPVMILLLGYPNEQARPSRLHSLRMPLEDMVTQL